MVHPAVHRDDEKRSGHPGDRDRDAGQEVRARREPLPAVGVDPDEDGLEEEGESLEREPEPEDVAEVLHPGRPQQPELEGQDGPGDDPDREQRQHDPRPAAGEHPVQVVTGPQVAPLGEQDEDGKGDAEAHQRDVHGQRKRLHLPRFEQIVLIRTHVPQPITAYYAT
nr:hypothetical protein [Trebonia kvetii]